MPIDHSQKIVDGDALRGRWHQSAGLWRLENSVLPSHDPPIALDGSWSANIKCGFPATGVSALLCRGPATAAPK
jgi:hypothetical protein